MYNFTNYMQILQSWKRGLAHLSDKEEVVIAPTVTKTGLDPDPIYSVVNMKSVPDLRNIYHMQVVTGHT